MTQPTPPMLRRAGFSLMELLIAVTVLTFVTGATYALFRSQSQNFENNTARYDLIENARGAIEAAERIIRTMGAGTPNNQPVLVYGANGVLAFNTDYVEQDTVDMRWATYFNVDTPLEETTAWTQAAQRRHSELLAVVHLSAGRPTTSATAPRRRPRRTSSTSRWMQAPRAAMTTSSGNASTTGRRKSWRATSWRTRTAEPFFEYLMQRQLSHGRHAP